MNFSDARSDGKILLYRLLFDLRGYLTAIRGNTTTLLNNTAGLTPETQAWLDELKLQVETWWRIQEDYRDLCRPDSSAIADWEKLIDELGKHLDSVPQVFADGSSRAPSSSSSPFQAGFEALLQALDRLCKFQILIVSGEYKKFLANGTAS